MWLLCLGCVSAPAWSADGGTGKPKAEDVLQELGWDVDGDDTWWKEDCSFAPGGELWRVSGSSEVERTISSAKELFALRRNNQTVLSLLQAGPEEPNARVAFQEDERWKVRCKPGRIDIVTPAIQVSLRVTETELELDPRFSRMLTPGSREPSAPAAQTLEVVLYALSQGPGSPRIEGLKEARVRARLLNAERALAANNLDLARDKLPPDDDVPAVWSWAESLASRLETLYSKPPLMAASPRRVGTLLGLPQPLDAEAPPVLFWRGSSLCVQQEESEPPRMRCVDARSGRWGRKEPYRNPHGEGWRVEVERGGDGHVQYVSTVSPEGSRKVHGGYYEPVVVARGEGHQLAVVSGQDPRENAGLKAFNFASGPGSLVAGGGRYYFAKPDELRSVSVEGLAWRFVLPGPQGELRCAVPPRVSPDGRWAACPVPQAAASDRPDARHDLYLFRLTPR